MQTDKEPRSPSRPDKPLIREEIREELKNALEECVGRHVLIWAGMDYLTQHPDVSGSGTAWNLLQAEISVNPTVLSRAINDVDDHATSRLKQYRNGDPT
jgi:hypothetical protein